MKKIVSLLLAGCLVFSCKVYAQSRERSCDKRSEIMLGISHNQLQEGSINTLVHKGFGSKLAYSRELVGCCLVQQFSASIASVVLRSRYEEALSSLHFHSHLSYCALFNIHPSTSLMRVQWGGISSLDYNIEYFNNWDENHYYWMSSYSIGTQLRIEYPTLNRGKIRIEAAFPLIVILSRPPERMLNIQSSAEFLDVLKTIHSEPIVALPNKHFELSVLTKYLVLNHRKVKPNFFWQLEYVSSDMNGSATRRNLTQSLGMGLGF